MKLSTFAFASTTVVLGIAACAAPSSEEDVDTSSQALCPRGVDCTKTGTGGFGGSTGGLVLDPGPSTPTTFTCDGQLIPGDVCSYVRPSCPAGDQYNCKCEKYCRLGTGPGGGFPIGSYSPCRAGQTYTCNYLGQCRCN